MSTQGYNIEAQDNTDQEVRDNANITGADTLSTASVGKKRGLHIHQLTDVDLQVAFSKIKERFGDTVVLKPKDLLKFGHTHNANADVKTEVMGLQGSIALENLITTNGITHVSSDNSADAGIELILEYHTIDGEEFTFGTQTVILNASDARTPVALTVPCARVSRAYNNNSMAQALVGNVYFFESDTVTLGVPDNAIKTHLMITAGKQQTEKAATTFSKYDYGIITGFYFSLNKDSSSTVNLDYAIELKEDGKVFRPLLEGSLRSSSKSSDYIPIRPYLIIPKNSDVRMVVTSNTNSTRVFAWFNSYIATIQQ